MTSTNPTDGATCPDGLRPNVDRADPAPRTAVWHVPLAWNAPETTPDEQGDPVRPLTALVSFHYLRAAIRRRWFVALVPAMLGVALSAAYLVLAPPLPTASTTLLLSHDQRADQARAIATDISLLASRTVAQRTIAGLGLSIAPDDLMESITVIPSSSSNVVQLTLAAPTGPEALRLLDRFTAEYLSFRGSQISAQSQALIQGYDRRIAELQVQARTIGARIRVLTASGGADSDELTDALAERSQLNGQIDQIRSTAEDAKLLQTAVVSTSRVIDPPALDRLKGLRHTVLAVASGLIAGTALGLGLVILQAILSDRLRLRVEVSAALNAPVSLSVGRLAPLPRVLGALRFLPWVKAAGIRRATDRQRMARVLGTAGRERDLRQKRTLAVLCLGNSADVRHATVLAATALGRPGHPATVVDLTVAGQVARAVARLGADPGGASPGEPPEVLRPQVVPSLTRGPQDVDPGGWDDAVPGGSGDATGLILADLDPAVGVDHLAAWTDRVVIAVTAGRSSVDLVRTAGDLVRAAGLELHSAVLLRALGDDMSSGLSGFPASSGRREAEPQPLAETTPPRTQLT